MFRIYIYMNYGQGLCATSCVETEVGSVCASQHVIYFMPRVCSCAVKCAEKRMGFLVWVSGDSRKNRPWAFLWVPLLEVTPGKRRGQGKEDPLLFCRASRHKKRREQSVIFQEVFSHLEVK